MTKPGWFEPKFTIGNVIQIALLLIGGLMAWSSLVSEVSTIKLQAEARDVRIEKLEESGDRTDKERQVERLELAKQLADMAADLRYMRAAFDDLRRSNAAARSGG